MHNNKSHWKKSEKSILNASASNPDEAVLQVMRRKKFNTSKKRPFYFYLYFPTYKNVQAAKAELLELDFTIDSIEQSDGKDWLCLACKELIPDSKILSNIRKKLEKLTYNNAGMFDGWETEATFE